MDACRSAARLKAERVYNIYRRTKSEMPANKDEISEAEEEGVIFKNLVNPIEIIGENGRAKAVRLQIMELGEPDASGRRTPVAVLGREEIVKTDIVIVAIGQKLDGLGFEEIEKTKWGTIAANEYTCLTNLPGVFAIGDATNKGADIAVSAIGEARLAADMIDKYLRGYDPAYRAPYIVKTEKTPADFAGTLKLPRLKKALRDAEVRRGDFEEINLGLTESEAKREASRCLECGCHAYLDCRLIKYSNQYDAKKEKYKSLLPQDAKHTKKEIGDFISLNNEKCILCGLCVRICEEVAKKTLFGFMNRGYNTVVDLFYDDLCEADCRACQKCAEACPTGALAAKRRQLFENENQELGHPEP
jgi:formate dehydrogenase major subunit